MDERFQELVEQLQEMPEVFNSVCALADATDIEARSDLLSYINDELFFSGFEDIVIQEDGEPPVSIEGARNLSVTELQEALDCAPLVFASTGVGASAHGRG